MPRPEPLRNPALVAELQNALASRRYEALFPLLRRFSGLPGPRANDALALAFAEEVVRAGAAGDELVQRLCGITEAHAPPGSDGEFLPMVGAMCLGVRLAANVDLRTLGEMRELADDARHRVRDAVVRALLHVSRTRGDELAEKLSTWTDGYLGAAVALEALTFRAWIDRARTPDAVLARLDEAIALVENAPRSDHRTQGYRLLVKAMSEAPSRLLDRFPAATSVWLESKASTGDVDLRSALDDLLQKAHASGHGAATLDKVEQAFAASAPPRRDPKTYVGPTRKRGARRR
ncbi:MAG: hypothetical protein ABW133_17365 [Polyangiaceae bacterium]